MARKIPSPLILELQKYEDQITETQKKLSAEFFKDVSDEMDQMDLSRSDLALTLDLNRSQVSRLFNTHGNLTLRTLVALASAVDHSIEIRLHPLRASSAELHPNVVQATEWLLNVPEATDQYPTEAEDGWPLVANGK